MDRDRSRSRIKNCRGDFEMSRDWREEISREERLREIRTKLIQNCMPVYAADVEAEILLIKEENERGE